MAATGGTRDNYHHGNLRAALLAAAEAELAEHGPEGFTLRSCAKRAGVSHAAPAHHFVDVSGLLTALAAEGFERFVCAMREGTGTLTHEGPEARLVAAGLSYIDFARANPALFRLMFASGRPDFSRPDLGASARAAFDNLVDSVAAASHDPSPLESARGRQRVARMWGLVHGLADLLISGHMKFLADQGEEGLRAELEAILQSAGIERG